MQKKTMKVLLLVAGLMPLMAACSSDNDEDATYAEGMGAGGSTDTSGDDLESFDVAINTEALTETETVPTDATAYDYEDYVENEDGGQWTNTFYLTYADGTVTGYPADDDEFTWVADGAHLTVRATKKAHYVLSGSASDGCLVIEGDDKKAWVELRGLTLTCASGPAIQKQSSKRLYLTLADGTVNTLCDGTTYAETDGIDQKATVFAEKKLIINGSGTLNIASVCTAGKNAIASDDFIRIRKNTNINITSTTKNGLKANDSIVIEGGVLNISVPATAGKGISSDGLLTVNGGRTTIITTGGGQTDSDGTSACACIKTDSIVTIQGGDLWLKSTGAGGKGISSDQEIYLRGGSLHVLTTGTRYGTSTSSQQGGPGFASSSSSDTRTSPKGIKGDKNVYVSGGYIRVRCIGGEGSEGIESKQSLFVSGGTVQASCYDDCLNAASSLTISGGSVYAYSSTNDGIDANGPLTISGGTVVASGSTAPEEGIDCDQNTFTLTGGTVVGIGGASSTPTTGSSTQPAILYGGSGSQGTLLTLVDGSGSHLLSYTVPRNYNQLTLLVSSPQLASGSTCYLYSGSSLAETSAFHGLQTGGYLTAAGSSLASATLGSTVTTIGSVSSGMGGGPGGRR